MNLFLTEVLQLCGMAQEWADQCAKKKSIAQRGDPEYGENVFCSGKKNASVQDAVTAWYAEGEKFPYGTENVKKKKYQFTQLVWKDTTDLGVGMATSVNGKVFVIANYYPKGNMPGTFSANVVQVIAN